MKFRQRWDLSPAWTTRAKGKGDTFGTDWHCHLVTARTDHVMEGHDWLSGYPLQLCSDKACCL